MIALLFAVEAHVQPFASAPLARDFVYQLQFASMEAFAAQDPDEHGRFVAALHIPGGPLLVVTAINSESETIPQRIRAGAYRDVYLLLQATPTPVGKFFVEDAYADGLLHALPGSGAVDVVYEDGVRATRFNGDPDAQGLSPAEYDDRFRDADRRYAHALAVLTASFQQRP